MADDPKRRPQLQFGEAQARAAGATARSMLDNTLDTATRPARAQIGAAYGAARAVGGAAGALRDGFMGGPRLSSPPQGGPDFSGVTGGASAPVTPSAPDFSSVRAGVRAEPVLQPGAPNSFTGSDGRTQRVDAASSAAPGAAGAVPASGPVVALRNQAGGVQEATASALDGQRRATLQARGDAASAINPMSDAGELMRRFNTSQRSYMNKGSPQARRMAGEAILNQLGAMNTASAAGQQATNESLQAAAAGEAQANESYAARRLEADTFNADDGYRRATLRAEQQRPTGTTVRGMDGTTSVLRNDGSTSTLRNEAGDPIRSPTPADAPRLVSPDVEFKALTESLDNMAQMRPAKPGPEQEAFDAQVASTRARLQQLAGAPAAAGSDAGPQLVGHRDGKPIYRDASGQLFIDEGR